MPRKLIDWTPQNDARLILTILAVENLHPNCEAIASAFGGSVNALSISNRLSRLRRKAAEEGIVAQPGAAGTAKGGKRNGAGKSGSGGNKSVPVHDDDSEGEMPTPHSRNNPNKGQKVLTGRVTKGRKPVKKDAKGLIKIDDDSDIEAGDQELNAAYGSEDEIEIQVDEDIDTGIKKEEGEDGADEEEVA